MLRIVERAGANINHGPEQGLERGQRNVAIRQARLKFGDAAELLACTENAAGSENGRPDL